MNMIGGDGSGIDEAWLIVLRQLQPGEVTLPAPPDNVDDDHYFSLPQIEPQDEAPVLTHEQPAYIAVFTRQTDGEDSTTLAPVQYYPLLPNCLFSAPEDSERAVPLPDIETNVLLQALRLMEMN